MTDAKVPFYELEKVRFIIKDSCELDIAYAYEDLVFSEHSLFIIQFDKEKSNNLYCWFNKDCIDVNRHSMFKSLTTSSNLNGMKISHKGKFEMTQKEGEEQISLKFIKSYLYNKQVESGQ
jgi:hypothetical protein